MAETRKFQPSSNAVADAVRAALGEPVRPVQPGETHAPQPSPTAARTVRTFTVKQPPPTDEPR